MCATHIYKTAGYFLSHINKNEMWAKQKAITYFSKIANSS